MNVVEGLKEIEVMRNAGTLSDAEFAQAKDHLLSEERESDASRQLALANLKLELDRIDREWSVEKEKYAVVTQYGYRRPAEEYVESTRIGSSICIYLGIALSILAIVYSFMMGPIAIFLGVTGGIVFIGGKCGMMDARSREEKYNEAKSRYQKGRAEVERQLAATKRQVAWK